MSLPPAVQHWGRCPGGHHAACAVTSISVQVTSAIAPRCVLHAQIAFSSVSVTLRHFLQDMAAGTWHVHHGVIDRRPDAAPNDPAGYVLRDHFKLPLMM